MKDLEIIDGNFPKEGSVTCFSCKQQMPIMEGTVIFGDKWYHTSCWKKIE